MVNGKNKLGTFFTTQISKTASETDDFGEIIAPLPHCLPFAKHSINALTDKFSSAVNIS